MRPYLNSRAAHMSGSAVYGKKSINYLKSDCNFMAIDISPFTFILPLIKAIIGLSVPLIIPFKSSSEILMVQSASLSSVETTLPVPVPSKNTLLAPKSNFKVFPRAAALVALLVITERIVSNDMINFVLR